MPIDADSNPYDGGLGADPASTKTGADGAVASKDDADLSLEDAGNGAKSADDLDVDLDGPAAKDLDLSLDDAGQGAKVDPSLTIEDDDDSLLPVDKSGLGSALDDLDVDSDIGAPVKDLAVEGIEDTDHIKGLAGPDPDHDDHDGHDHDDDHDDDAY